MEASQAAGGLGGLRIYGRTMLGSWKRRLNVGWASGDDRVRRFADVGSGCRGRPNVAVRASKCALAGVCGTVPVQASLSVPCRLNIGDAVRENVENGSRAALWKDLGHGGGEPDVAGGSSGGPGRDVLFLPARPSTHSPRQALAASGNANVSASKPCSTATGARARCEASQRLRGNAT